MKKVLLALVLITAVSATSCKKDKKCWQCSENNGNNFGVKKCMSEKDIRAWEQANNYTCTPE